MVQPNTEKVLASVLQQSLKRIPRFSTSSLGEILYLDFPKDRTNGDLFTNICFKIASHLNTDPLSLAKELTEILKEEIQKNSDLSAVIERIECAGKGYINFFFKNEFFYDILENIIREKDKFGSLQIGKGKKVLIEFVSANPTGPLSVAHARQGAFGDCLANILSFLDYKVTREYYINDEGNQINILGKSVQARCQELMHEPFEFKEDYYQGEYIYDIAKAVIDKKLSFKTIGDFAAFAVEDIIKAIEKDLDDFGVKFDVWYSQKKQVKKERVNQALDYLKEKGFIYENEGAKWFKSTQFGDDKDRVVVKSDGEFTYLAPDVAYHQDKFKRGFVWLINIWGPDHHGYIPRLKSAVEALGKKKEDLAVIIIQLATIYKDGKPIQMSTRRGQYISLREILDEVGKDAARFFFMMRKSSSHLDFDLDLAKKQAPENPVYYIQYAHARISSIIGDNRVAKADDNLSLLKEPLELELMRLLSEFPYVLESCLRLLEPCGLPNYLQDIAKSFHKFYDQHRVLVDDENLKQARLTLIYATKIVLANGLRLLGISAPEKM